MFKVINNKTEFIQNPVLEMNDVDLKKANKNIINLFGKDYTMYDDEWKHHVHIKCTDHCDANCAFCIEKSERNNPQNKKNVLESAREVLSQMAMQNQLRTVSITGGEPTLFPYIKELVNYINSYKLTLFSINTNGRFLDRIPENFNGWVDISKHASEDSDIFQRDFNLESSDVIRFKRTHPNAKVRFQCVLGVSDKMSTIENIIDFIQKYNTCVDDFSFRNLIINNDEGNINSLVLDLRNLLFNDGEFVEQVIQDYYVYETYKLFGTSITISWSNMKELREYNERHNNSFLEEIIVHPDGTVSGSWNKKSLIIYKPENKDGNTFIQCKGINCTKHCPRYVEKKQKLAKQFSTSYTYVDTCNTGSSIDTCGSISGC